MRCGSGEPSPTAPGPAPPPPTSGRVLASGEISLPAATAPGEAGDHEPFTVDQALRTDLDGSSGARLVVTLRDLSRPGILCDDDDPQRSECAAIDWSDDPAEPRVPPDGVFLNRLTVELATGDRDYYLSRDFRLADVPDLIDPNHEHTAIGGNPVRWETTLPADLVGGSGLRLRFVLSKWQPPAVRIGFAVTIDP